MLQVAPAVMGWAYPGLHSVVERRGHFDDGRRSCSGGGEDGVMNGSLKIFWKTASGAIWDCYGEISLSFYYSIVK